MPIDKTYHDEETLYKVRRILERYLRTTLQLENSDRVTLDIVNKLQNQGILFREKYRED